MACAPSTHPPLIAGAGHVARITGLALAPSSPALLATASSDDYVSLPPSLSLSVKP